MENITKGVSELSAEDSGSSQDNKGDSVTSTDNAESISGSEVAETNAESVSSVEGASSSKHHSITTRSSKKVREQQLKDDDHSYPISSPSTAMDITEDASGGFVEGGHSISTRSSRRRGTGLNKHHQTMKFMENFDPEHSNRERKKLTRQITSSGKRKPTLYDEKGVLIGAEVDLCDCLDEECPGCHFPCPKCHSNKCGHECRQNRRWTYEEIWTEGTNKVVTNPLLGSNK